MDFDFLDSSKQCEKTGAYSSDLNKKLSQQQNPNIQA